MRRVLLLVFLLARAACDRFAFFKDMRRSGESRRVFGGSSARALPQACVLLDRTLSARCSCTVLAPRWALTAAHCAAPAVAYVRYNVHSDVNSDIAPVHLLYSHPEFQVKEADEGHGMDVVLLHHDVGLVRTRRDMRLDVARSPSAPDILDAAARYDPDLLLGQEVEVLGFGRTSESAGLGAELRAVRLRVARCGRERWLNCACAAGDSRGVCSGDSGGPVMYNGTQVGVTSMGPTVCAATGEPAREGALSVPAVSVFTALRPYAALIHDTMHSTDDAIKMRIITGDAAARNLAGLLTAAAALAVLF